MLSEQAKELLTGLVDGELDERQHRKAMLLLQQYPEAMEFLRHLQMDADAIRGLPAPRLKADFSDRVMDEIIRRSQPKTFPMRRRRWKPYVAAGLAASLLLGVFSGTLFHWLTRDEEVRIPSGSFVFQKSKARIPSVDVPVPRGPNPLIAEMVEGIYSQYAAPIPPDREFRVAFQELRKEGPATTGLDAELQKQKSLNLDVTVRNGSLAFNRLAEALKDRQIKLAIDAQVAKALASKEAAKHEYWVYVENVKADEVSKLLRDLSQDDPNGKQFQATPFAKLMVAGLEGNQKAEIAKKLGFANASGMDATSTANMLPEPKTPTKKVTERIAVVLPNEPNVGMKSDEVRQFVFNRQKAGAGTVPVLIRLRVE